MFFRKYHFPAPDKNPFSVLAYDKKLFVVDRLAYRNIKNGNIEVINSTLEAASKDSVTLQNGETLECDSLIMGTGYRHGLEEFFGENAWKNLGKRYAVLTEEKSHQVG